MSNRASSSPPASPHVTATAASHSGVPTLPFSSRPHTFTFAPRSMRSVASSRPRASHGPLRAAAPSRTARAAQHSGVHALPSWQEGL